MKLKNIIIVLAATVLLCGMAGCGSKQEAQTTGPVAYPDTQPPISQMESGEFTFSYPDLGTGISFQETEDGLQLQEQLEGQSYTAFTVLYNSDVGDIVLFYEYGEGQRIPVAFQMASLPDGLTGEQQRQFYEAQDLVNEVIQSLQLR